MYKSRKTENKNENTFKQPKIQATKEIKTHLRERTTTEKLLYLFTVPNKQKTIYRMVLTMPHSDLEKSIYIITEKLLSTLITDKRIDKTFYSALSRIFKISKADVLKKLCVDYLRAQMSYDKQYTTFLEFLLRHFKDAIVEHREEIASFVDDKELKARILALKRTESVQSINYKEPYYLLR
ncbi:hypothetical protein GINT2_000746 [Glugoides intestinalis]